MGDVVRVRNESKGTVLAERAVRATRFFERLLGLLGRSELPAGDGLWIQPCNSVHMWFMRFPIDVVFAAEDGRVIAVVSPLPVWSMTRLYRGAVAALELPVGVIAATRTAPGDRIVHEPTCA